jgi:hypothetical protein
MSLKGGREREREKKKRKKKKEKENYERTVDKFF